LFVARHTEPHGIRFAVVLGTRSLMRRFPAIFVLTGLAAVTAGCLTLMPVSSHIERGADFTRYRTYAWGPADAVPVSDPRLRENPFFVDDVHGAVDTELQDRGLRPAMSEPADLLVHYHAAVTGRLEVPSAVGTLPDCVGDECRPKVAGYDAGTLVIDMVDTRTQRVVFRGWAEHRLEDMLDDLPLVHRRISDAVHRIFGKLPLTVTARSRGDALEVAP
jgi:hypothetical protein